MSRRSFLPPHVPPYEPPHSRARRREGSPLRVLIVEDNLAYAELVRQYLSAASRGSYTSTCAETLDAALRAVAQDRYDLILSDLTLPDACDTDCVEYLCNEAPSATLIVLSGEANEDLALRAVQLGAQDYLIKSQVDATSLDRSVRYSMERKRTELRLSQLAHYDQLTGLANRVTFRDKLESALARAQRHASSLWVLFLDLDRFKPINDSLGHDAGDELLVQVAGRLRATLGPESVIARLGGDEFAALLEGTALHDLRDQCVHLLEELRSPFLLCDQPVSISASIGAAAYPACGGSTQELLRAADEAMYGAKRAGRATYRISSRDDVRHACESMRIEASVREAVDADELKLVYQPQVDLVNQRIVGFEALLRCERAGESIAPSQFVPILEEVGLIRAVGANVLSRACRQLRRWHQQGLDQLRISVNVSATQLADDAVVHHIGRILDEHRVPGHQLEIEITESALMRDMACADRVISQLVERGLRVAIDDFGTGHSSLSSLHRFGVTALKLDHSFVQALGDEGPSDPIASAVIGLGRRLGLDVIAEGVESEEQLHWLATHGCTGAQGYLFSPPRAEWTAADIDEVTARVCRGPKVRRPSLINAWPDRRRA